MRRRMPDSRTLWSFVSQAVGALSLGKLTRQRVVLLVALTLQGAAARGAPQAVQLPPGGQVGAELQATVLDENGVAVPSARLTLTPQAGPPVRGETDYAGRKRFADLVPGIYSLGVEKESFFAVTDQAIHVGEVASVDVTLNHVREFSEQVNVVYSPPAIDPAKTQASETLNSEEIIDLPFAVTRDIRYALPLLPGVLQDYTGQLHVDGASTRQIYDQIDGFNVSDPATGQFQTRVSVDAVRSAEVASSRYSTEYGKGSGGVISLRTGMGDDHWRVTATDFFPAVKNRKGIHPNTWTPRGLISGPLSKGKAWFLDAWEGEYDLNIFNELPTGADRNSVWRVSNLSKAQINLAQNNNLTASFLMNYFRSPHAGLDPFDPLSTTLNSTTDTFLFTVKDQHLFHNGMLLESGVAVSHFKKDSVPTGIQTYVVTPDGSGGNFYATNHGHAERTEVIANLFLPPVEAGGRHELKLGFDADRVADHQEFNRLPYLVKREDGTLSRSVDFTNAPPFTRYNVEGSFFAQDRWSVTNRWLLEPGVRLDGDEIIRNVAPSPRLASTVMVRRNGDIKISWGIGIYRDPSNLDILTRSLTGTRTDSFYDATGLNLIQPPVVSTFTVDQRRLRFPRVTNWSVAIDQKLPRATYLRLQFVEKRGRDIWTFLNPAASTSPTGPFAGEFILTNGRHDRYDAAELTLRHVFRQNYVVFASYTRSRAHSDAVFNYNLDNVLFSPQAGGPLAWDTPSRFLSWGWLPILHKFDLAYTLDWRAGFPFTLQNDTQQVVGPPGSRRFPVYIALDLGVERRFTLLGFQWALRGGVDDITNRANASFVDSNIDSPHYLTFSGIQGRAFTGRIRLLGRK